MEVVEREREVKTQFPQENYASASPSESSSEVRRKTIRRFSETELIVGIAKIKF